MFSNGKFKNIVAEVDVSKQIGPGETLHGVYSLLPIRGKDVLPADAISLIDIFIIYREQAPPKIG